MVESLQNRPPNFHTTPVLEATASSGFEIATVPIGNQPVAAAILNGFQGNRIVVANAGDQRIGVYEPTQSDEYAEEFTVSTVRTKTKRSGSAKWDRCEPGPSAFLASKR